MKHINVVLQCRKRRGSKNRFTAPLPAVKDKELEGPVTARELCSGVSLVPLRNPLFSSRICPKMKTRPDFHVPFKCIGVGSKDLHIIRYWNILGHRQQGGTRVAMKEWCPCKAPAKLCPFLSQMKRWIGKTKSVVSPGAAAPHNHGSPQKGRCHTAMHCGDELQELTWLSPSHHGPSLLTASSCQLSWTDPAAHTASQEDPGRGRRFPGEDQWSLVSGWNGTEVPDSSLDTDSCGNSWEKNCPSFLSKDI